MVDGHIRQVREIHLCPLGPAFLILKRVNDARWTRESREHGGVVAEARSDVNDCFPNLNIYRCETRGV